MEGDVQSITPPRRSRIFLSTPSGWRATPQSDALGVGHIHFYPRPPGGGRQQSGRAPAWDDTYFYPRPPGGGRLQNMQCLHSYRSFLSTPSGWRATSGPVVIGSMPPLFLSTPSGWRATATSGAACAMACRFLSTPSGWRATLCIHQQRAALRGISIHALRVEGDAGFTESNLQKAVISIHALRVEGDVISFC